MRRVSNADQFLGEFRRRRAEYEQSYIQSLERIRQKYTADREQRFETPEFLKAEEEELLEAHAREFMINSLLTALNWRMNVSEEAFPVNLVPETPLRSAGRKTIRFLDYLGFERDTGRPLLVVEAKSPRSQLPKRLKASSSAAANYVSSYERFVADTIASGLRGEKILGSEWDGWLRTLQDYVHSLQQQSTCVPERVAMTNGDWLLLFLDPTDAFIEDQLCDPTKILVYEDRGAIERKYVELFRALEHQSLLNETPSLSLGELPFHVASEVVTSAMYGLQLLYIEEPGFREPSPVIKVMPLVFLRTCYGHWLRVESHHEERLPHRSCDLASHLERVRSLQVDLLEGVKKALNIGLSVQPVTKHYSDEEAFRAWPAVTSNNGPSGAQAFSVITGANTHYLLPEPTVQGCPHHDWGESNRQGCASNPGPIGKRSTQPRSFFVSGELHHCAHREATKAKASQISSSNRSRCGLRSGQDGQAFCEIGRFEEHLCCRTCAFEEVCTKAEVFILPCQRLKEV